MTNEQIIRSLYEIHDRLCRSLSAIESRLLSSNLGMTLCICVYAMPQTE